MKNFSDSRLFSTLLFFLIVGVIAKIIWLSVAMLFLPKSGVEHIEVSKTKPLFYRVKLAKQSTKKKAPPKVIKQKPVIGTMNGIKLIALYNASDALVVTVKKAKKTKVLAKGENIDGFILSSAGSDYAIFRKGKKEFKLILKDSKIKNPSSITKAKSSPSKPKKDLVKGIVKNEDGIGKIVSKGLLSSYTKDIDKVWKDIGIDEYKVKGQLQGFKVNFVKKGSDFEKLDLRRGDILKAVNGQELNSYNAAFSFYKEMESIENLTLSIIRNNQEMELEYEIK
ncbi:General secretion pathway protein C [hydrothermal vent metagenome]|uniref:General secretion pathway protein C n=1 Tax=hydrothermal vent metagenome TaxID=652676 RepID=A0A1W1C367_9ZZZZ